MAFVCIVEWETVNMAEQRDDAYSQRVCGSGITPRVGMRANEAKRRGVGVRTVLHVCIMNKHHFPMWTQMSGSAHDRWFVR